MFMSSCAYVYFRHIFSVNEQAGNSRTVTTHYNPCKTMTSFIIDLWAIRFLVKIQPCFFATLALLCCTALNPKHLCVQ